jgi:hypothetical protein
MPSGSCRPQTPSPNPDHPDPSQPVRRTKPRSLQPRFGRFQLSRDPQRSFLSSPRRRSRFPANGVRRSTRTKAFGQEADAFVSWYRGMRVDEGADSGDGLQPFLGDHRQDLEGGSARALLAALPLADKTGRYKEVAGERSLAGVLAQPDGRFSSGASDSTVVRHVASNAFIDRRESTPASSRRRAVSCTAARAPLL